MMEPHNLQHQKSKLLGYTFTFNNNFKFDNMELHNL
jgi:hypothetical protein